MKLKGIILFILMIILVIAGCTKKEEIPHDKVSNEMVYYGKGDNWLATYSLFKVNKSLFESIYIQYIGGNRDASIGPIEYELEGSEYKSSSSYPQELQGVRSFQVSAEFNADLFSIKPMSDGTYKLMIKSKVRTEILSLSKISK